MYMIYIYTYIWYIYIYDINIYIYDINIYIYDINIYIYMIYIYMIYIYTWIYECPSLNLTPVGATRTLPALPHRCHGSSPHWIGRSNPGSWGSIYRVSWNIPCIPSDIDHKILIHLQICPIYSIHSIYIYICMYIYICIYIYTYNFYILIHTSPLWNIQCIECIVFPSGQVLH